MNLDESSRIASEIAERSRKKRIIGISIFLCIILMVFIAIMIFFILYKDANTLKFYLNGSEMKFSAGFFDNNTSPTYVNVNRLARILNLGYSKGGYHKYDEDENSCYITGLHEVVSMSVDGTTYTKYLVDAEESDKKRQQEEAERLAYGQYLTLASAQNTEETFDLIKPLKVINEEIYVSLEDVGTMFNLRINTAEKYRVRFYTMESLFKSAKQSITKAGYEQISYLYENMRCLLNDMMVVGPSVSKFGVVNTKTLEVKISCTYTKLVYLQNVSEFFVYVDNTCALYSDKGDQIIKPQEFDDISVLDRGATASNRLYKVKKNNKYGVLNRSGDAVIHPEYDYIGLNPSDYGADKTGKSLLDGISNTNILWDKVIPVKAKDKDGQLKYGLFNLKGDLLADTVYDLLGCRYIDSKVQLQNGQSGVILLPESIGIKGIVLYRDNSYGIFDAEVERLIVPTVCSEVYKILKAGETTYYIVFGGTQYDLQKYIRDNNLISVKEQEQSTTTVDEFGNTVLERPVSTEGEQNITTTNSVTESVSDGNYVAPANTESVNPYAPEISETKPVENIEQPVEHPIEENPVEQNPVEGNPDQPVNPEPVVNPEPNPEGNPVVENPVVENPVPPEEVPQN